MNRFLKEMDKALKFMDKAEREEILIDYREHFEDGALAGKTEDEVAASLGDPQQLARMYTALGATKKAMKSSKLRDAGHMIGAIAKYKMGGGLIVGSVYFGCIIVMAVLFAAAGVLVASGSLVLVYSGFAFAAGGVMYGIAGILVAVVLACAGLLGIVYLARLWKWVFGALPRFGHKLMEINREEEESWI